MEGVKGAPFMAAIDSRNFKDGPLILEIGLRGDAETNLTVSEYCLRSQLRRQP
jgi:hypothetical protein